MKNLHPNAYWLFAIRGIVSSIFATVFLSIYFGLEFSERNSNIGGTIILIALGFLVITTLINLGWSYLVFKAYKYELTEDGFKKEMGVINKKYVTIPYDRIQNIDIDRGILARILGLSELSIQTAGGSMMMYRNRNNWNRMYAEGVLAGISKEDADSIREELIKRSKGGDMSQGL